jgi:hypothetical protein
VSSNRIRVWLLRLGELAVVAGIGYIAARAFSGHEPAPPRVDSASAAEVAALRAEVALLHARPVEISAISTVDAGSVDVPPEPPAAASDTLANGATEEFNPSRQVATLATRMASEGKDSSAETAATQLRSSLSGDDYRGIAADVECTASLCRIHFSAEPGEDGESSVHKLPFSIPWKAQGISTYDMERLQGDYYVAREGFPLFPSEGTSL